MRFLHACTSYAAKSNSLPILRKDGADKVKLRPKVSEAFPVSDKLLTLHKEKPRSCVQTSSSKAVSFEQDVDKNRSNSVTDIH
ncbi:hypothetical protein BIW11_12785, partial [Tropilaelaps mercedesae]